MPLQPKRYNNVRIRFLTVPFLVISIALACLYSLFNWLFLIKWQLLKLDEGTVHFWLPVGLSLIATIIWIRKYLRILKDFGAGRWSFFGMLYCVAVIGISFPTQMAQSYVEQVTDAVTHGTISAINMNNSTAPYNSPYAVSTQDDLFRVFFSLFIWTIIWTLMILIPPVRPEELKKLLNVTDLEQEEKNTDAATIHSSGASKELE